MKLNEIDEIPMKIKIRLKMIFKKKKIKKGGKKAVGYNIFIFIV
jgi:hypothetical protein